MSLALAQRALDADPDDALAMALLGWERIHFRGDYTGLALCSRAVALNPNNRAVLDLASVAHLFAGDLNEVIACGMRALQLSPGAPDNYNCLEHIASAHFSAGRFEEAAEWAQRSIDLEKGLVVQPSLPRGEQCAPRSERGGTGGDESRLGAPA